MKPVRIILILFILLTVHSKVSAQRITVTGDWSLTIGEADLQGGAGSDLNSQYMSASNQIIIDINNINTGWSLYVEGAIIHWQNPMAVWIRRTGDGSGHPLGYIDGGTSWQQVTLSSQLFYWGSRRRISVPVQLGLNGVSVQIPEDVYSGTITYTVIAN
jgi:hypothetical protein